MSPGAHRGQCDVQVQVDKDRNLIISGTRKAADDTESAWKAQQTERRQGGFSRKFKLYDDADVSKIFAKTVDGVLTITVRKLESAEPKETSIPVY